MKNWTITSVLRNSIRTLPSALIALAVSMAMAKFLLRVADAQLAATAVVPVLSMFIVNRMLVLLTSFYGDGTSSEPEAPRFAKVFGTVFILATISTAVGLLSSATYTWLHLVSARNLYMAITKLLSMISLVGFVGMLVFATWRPLGILFGAMLHVLLSAILRVPAKFVEIPRHRRILHGR